jgi:hypothetical protein
MEIEKALGTAVLNNEKVQPGSLLRVKVLSSLGKGRYLVEFKGKLHQALLSENIPHRFFIARVLRVNPSIVLKFVAALEGRRASVDRTVLVRLLNTQKPSIMRLVTAGESPVIPGVVILPDEGHTRENLKKSIRRQSIPAAVRNPVEADEKAREYVILQSILNYVDPDTLMFCLPLKHGAHRDSGELKLFSGKHGENGVFLLVHLDHGVKVAFLVSVDYESCVCTIGTNDRDMEHLVEANIRQLQQGLEELYTGREVAVRTETFDEEGFDRFTCARKINIKM